MKKSVLAMILISVFVISCLTGCGKNGSTEGSVYFLNFKPEQDQAWQDLAKAYTEETGVLVEVVTAASGGYETTLMSEMSKGSAPTLFSVTGPSGLLRWKDYCYDMADTDIYGELLGDDYALIEGDTVYGVASLIESYGLIVNKDLLSKAGYSIDDIKSFDQLKAVSEDITSRSAELGFSAFTSAGMDDSSNWRYTSHLSSLPVHFEYADKGVNNLSELDGTYIKNFRNVFDLYINNSTCKGDKLAVKTQDDSRNEFLAGKAVFYQNGSWEYTSLSEEFDDNQLAMIPIYIGAGDEANQGLCTGTENYWCVNKFSSEEDIAATLDFMNWCVASETGTKAMGENMGYVIPYKNAVETSNLFACQNAEYTAQGRQIVPWAFTTMPSVEWKSTLASALTAYAAAPTDKNWKTVEKAFVDNWAVEYELSNEY